MSAALEPACCCRCTGPAPVGRFDGHRLHFDLIAQLTFPQVGQSQLPLTPATGIFGLFPVSVAAV